MDYRGTIIPIAEIVETFVEISFPRSEKGEEGRRKRNVSNLDVREIIGGTREKEGVKGWMFRYFVSSGKTFKFNHLNSRLFSLFYIELFNVTINTRFFS